MIKVISGMVKRLLLPALAVLGLMFATYYSIWGQSTSYPPATEESQRLPVHPTGVLAGSGVIEPHGQTVTVAAPLPGVVEWVISEDRVGTVVKKGEVLMRLDARQQQAELEVRKASLASAEVEVKRQKAMPRPEDVAPAEGTVRQAQATLDDKNDLYQRAVQLAGQRAISAEEVNTRKFAAEVAHAQLDVAQADLKKIKAGAWAHDIAVAEAAVQKARAEVLQAQTDLDRMVVKAQSDQVLLKVDVRPQEYVGVPPGKTLISLGDMSQLQVRVELDENDAPRFRPQLKVLARLRGQSQGGFPLVYVRTEPIIIPKQSLSGESTERLDVRVLQMIYRFQNSEDQKKVYLGQQVDVLLQDA